MTPTTTLVLAILGAVGTIWAIVTYFLPPFSEYKKNRRSEKNVLRGPYPEKAIEDETQYYLRPRYSLLDPSLYNEPRDFSGARKDLFEAVDFFLLKDSKHRHLFLLADSGMGKTSFMLNYFAYNESLPASKKQKIAIVNLGWPDSNEYISKAASSDASVIILDALDEDIDAINDFEKRFEDLMKRCSRFKKIILTCRTQFFPNDESIPLKAGLQKIEPVSAGAKKDYEFVRYYLLTFSDDDVKQYVNKRFRNPDQKEKALELIKKAPFLTTRPMLLTYIPDLLEVNQEINNSYQVYEAMVDAWIAREHLKTITKTDLRKFFDHLAVDLYLNRDTRRAEQIPYDELSQLARQWNIQIDQWEPSLRSLLNRDSYGNYKFAHRTIMEFLFVRQLIEGNENCYGVQLTDQMIIFLQEALGLRVLNLGRHDVTAVSSSILLESVLNKDFSKFKIDGKLKLFILLVALGVAWNKMSSALFLEIDKIIRQYYPSDNYFSVGDWRIIEEKLVALATNEKSEKEKRVIERQLREFLLEIPTIFSRSNNFQEIPEIDNHIARNLALELLELGVSYEELEPKLLNSMEADSIHFWGNKYIDWYLWHKITLLHFMIQVGNGMLQDVLTIRKNALLVPLFNLVNDKFIGLTFIIK